MRFQIPLSIDCLETGAMRESKYVPNVEDSGEGGAIRFVFNRKGDTRGASSRLIDFFCSHFHAKDLTINVET
jgi:hypothetical protein